ncbi:hypothetical protein [Erythrobacter rubeus]|uniref:DUF1330 domain-containing protein n=1 Tax=Erythrobacter rubeus TaxID=2760803 RepID=A0ABR8KS26_9SPHN|nr:hypothetical protein [Erythrobacter rubeus]MBD2841249.1 hypothetical protein [Erythrobacter rubeus]
MNTLHKSVLLAATVFAGTIACTGSSLAQQQPSPPAASAQPAPGFSVKMKKGEVLQVIASELRPDSVPAARQYGQSAFPLAQTHGFKRLGQLNVRETVISDFAPQAFSFFSWPSQQAVDDFAAEPGWPAIKAVRPQAWSELKVYSAELEDDLDLQFDPGKHYTVLVAWLNDDDAVTDYNRYLTGIEPAVERSGGRFIYKMRMPSMEAHASDPAAPHQLTFVEWETTDGFDRVQQSQEYLDFRQFFGSSVNRFEFYWMKTPSR